MSQQDDSGEKTEKPTPKKLKDARRRGEVPKSREVTSTIGLIAWIFAGVIALYFLKGWLTGLFDASLDAVQDPSKRAFTVIGTQAFLALMLLVGSIATPVILVSLLAEFSQVGPIATLEKVKPKFDHLNPVGGFKRMFSMDNLIEVLKALFKTILLFAIAAVVVRLLLPNFHRIPAAGPQSIGIMYLMILLYFIAGTILVFIFVAILDAAYQKFSFMKKQRMSMRDIRQEHKENEGDPQLKQNRKQLHQEWSEHTPALASAKAAALIVNPTHLALALHYEREENDVPVITAKGADHVAQSMRRAAEDNDVPVLQDVRLARELYRQVNPHDPVPAEYYDVIAEIIVWAQRLREERDASPAGAHDTEGSGI